MTVYDYGIIGGGPAGYTAGMLLAKQGYSVVHLFLPCSLSVIRLKILSYKHDDACAVPIQRHSTAPVLSCLLPVPDCSHHTGIPSADKLEPDHRKAKHSRPYFDTPASLPQAAGRAL